MVKFVQIIFSNLLLLSILSCAPSAPYEIKSPCVTIETENDHFIKPCIRKPINLNRAIV